MSKTFVADGYVYAQCVMRKGRLVCRPGGKYFRFPAYKKKIPLVAEKDNQNKP